MARFVPAIVLAALLALPAAAQVYKWVDKDGKTHYGEKPPEGMTASPVGVPPPSSAAPKDDWRQREVEFRKRQIEREKAQEAEQAEKASRAGDVQKCARLRDDIEVFKSPQRIYDRDTKGEKVYLEDAQRARILAEMESLLAKHCR